MFTFLIRLRRTLASAWRKNLRRFGLAGYLSLGRSLPAPKRSVLSVARNTLRRFLRKTTKLGTALEPTAYVPSRDERQSFGWKDFANPLNWFRWTGGFAVNWLVSRPYGSFLTATPAILFAAGLATIVVFSSNRDASRHAAHYRVIFDQAVQSSDYATAAIAIGSLTDSTPQNPDLLYQSAIVEHLQGNTDQAIGHMRELAIEKKHGKAAMWLISKTCDLQSLANWSGSEHNQFRDLIEIGLNHLDKDNLISAKVLMFSYLAEIGALGEASRYLLEVVPGRPELALAAATLCRTQHDADGTAKYAVIAERHFEAVLSSSPRDVNTRINLARALMIQQKFEAAAKLLNDGYRLTSDRRLTAVVGEALVVWSDHLGEKDADSKNLLKRLQILSAAVRIAPNDPSVSKAIMLLLTECRRNPSPKVVRLREEILSGTNPVSTGFIRGTLAMLDGKLEEGRRHLEAAASEQPGLPSVLNNLAVALSESPADDDLQQALTLANAAIEKIPEHPYFLETRGQILLKLQRPKDAILDLELALQAEELRPSIYPSLAKAYEQLGVADMTQMYRELASRMH